MPAATPVVLLSGWSTAGKDAVAGLLVARCGCTRLAFADALKDIVTAELGLPRAMADTSEGKAAVVDPDSGSTLRDVLIRRGAELRASSGHGVFAATVVAAIAAPDQPCRGFVVSDWRMADELDTVVAGARGAPVITARVNRAGLAESPVADSATEHALDAFPFNYTIDNPGTTLEDLWTCLVASGLVAALVA